MRIFGEEIEMDDRPICSACNERMTVKYIGVQIEYSETQYQRGDAFICGVCGREIIANFGKPYPKRNVK